MPDRLSLRAYDELQTRSRISWCGRLLYGAKAK